MSDSVEFKPTLLQIRETARILRLALLLVWRSSSRLLVGFILLLVLQALLVPLQLALTRVVIDRAAFDLGLLENLDAAAALLPLLLWIGLAAAVLALGQLIQPFSSTFQSLAADRLTGYVTEQIIRAANRQQGLAPFEDPAFADDLQRARKRAPRGALNLIVYVGRAAIELFTAGGLALVLFALHPLVPFLLILASLPQMKRQWAYSERTIGHLYIQTAESRRLEYSREVLLAPEAAKDIHLYAVGPFFRRRYDSIFASTTESLNQMRKPLAVRVSLAAILATVASSAVYVYVAWLILQGDRTVGDLALYGGAATVLQMNLIALGTEIGLLPSVLGFLPSLFRILEAPPDLPQGGRFSDTTGASANRPLLDEAVVAALPLQFQSIAFENVSFTYPGGADLVLRDLSFTMAPDECVALVGRNGAGKTTIVKLLLRLFDSDLRPHPPERRRPARLQLE